jgi:hypothetical protein
LPPTAIAGGLPADSGFETAFLMSAGVALAAAAFGLLIPATRGLRGTATAEPAGAES